MFNNIEEAIEHCELEYNQLKDTCPECALEYNQFKEWLLDYKKLKANESYHTCIERMLGLVQESLGQSINSHLTKEDIDDILNGDCDLADDIKKDLIELKEKIEKRNITK